MGRRKGEPTNGKLRTNRVPLSLFKLPMANNHSQNCGKIPRTGPTTSPKFEATIPEQKYSKKPLVPGLVADTEFICLKKRFCWFILGWPILFKDQQGLSNP